MDAPSLLKQISPPLDSILAASLLSEFLDLERRFVLGDWEPATLNGGQFAEIAARIIYHMDAGNLNRRKSFDECLKYIEEDKGVLNHAFPNRRASLHLCKALRTVYKLRSQRGAVHIDPDYSANELDSMFIVASARWIMSEVLRIFWQGSTSVVANAIREIVRFQVPAVLSIDGRHLVLRTDCTVEEEILILLHNVGERGLSRSDLGKAIPKSPAATTLALQKLCSPEHRQVIQRVDRSYLLSPNGQKRVQEELSNKLALK
jgi:hypothetical protein